MSILAALNVTRKYASGGAVETNPPMRIKKHINFQGLQISIETSKGEIRRGIDHEGKPWANRMAADYGYIKRTEGKDGDQVDAFVGPFRNSNKVFIIDQLHHHKEKFDEHKCLLGFNTRKQALTAYHNSYGRVYGHHHTVGAVTELSIEAFKEWLKGGGGKEPVAPDVPKYQAGGAVADEKRSLVFDPEFVGKTQPAKTPNIRVAEGHQEFEKGYAPSGRSPWNTDYPYRPILNMRGQELHALKIKTGGVVKATKEKANYRLGTKAKHCGICQMFRSPDSCTAVEGKIRPEDTCDYFEKIKGKASGGKIRTKTMPLKKGSSPATISQNISEFHTGPTYAATKAKFGKAKADKQAIAAAMSTARRYGKGKAFGGPNIESMIMRGASYGLRREGMINSTIPGRTDKIPMRVPAGSYILAADIPSALGQGNSLAGGEILKRMFNAGPYGLPTMRSAGRSGMSLAPRMSMRTPRPPKGMFAEGGETEGEDENHVPIIAAGMEYIVPPEVVKDIGHGSVDAGHRVLDRFQLNVRKKNIETLKRLPGPKK